MPCLGSTLHPLPKVQVIPAISPEQFHITACLGLPHPHLHPRTATEFKLQTEHPQAPKTLFIVFMLSCEFPTPHKSEKNSSHFCLCTIPVNGLTIHFPWPETSGSPYKHLSTSPPNPSKFCDSTCCQETNVFMFLHSQSFLDKSYWQPSTENSRQI